MLRPLALALTLAAPALAEGVEGRDVARGLERVSARVIFTMMANDLTRLPKLWAREAAQ